MTKTPEPPDRRFADMGEADQHLKTAAALERASVRVRAHLQANADWAEAERRTAELLGDGGALERPSIATASLIGCAVLAAVLAEVELSARPGYLAAFIGMVDDFARSMGDAGLEMAAAAGAA